MASKAKRKTWFTNLTPEKRDAYISAGMESKSARRRARSVAMMEKAGLSYDCKRCVHGRTSSCTDNLPDGCEHYFESN